MTKTTGNTMLQSFFVSHYLLEILSNPELQNIKIATYHNLGKAYSRMSELLEIFEFTSFNRYITENKMLH